MKRNLILLMAGVGLTLTTYQAGVAGTKGKSEHKQPTYTQSFLPVWRNADSPTWKAFYGEPIKVANAGTDSDKADALTWDYGRFEVEATFYSNLKLCCINIEGKEGQDPLTFTEAKALANSLGLPPYHMDDGAPTWGDTTDAVTAFFSDAAFHFEASHESDPNSVTYD
jgi:hypothetical protein